MGGLSKRGPTGEWLTSHIREELGLKRQAEYTHKSNLVSSGWSLVRFASKSGHSSARVARPLCARSGHLAA